MCAFLSVRNIVAVRYRVPEMKTDAALDEGDKGPRKLKLAAPKGVADMNRFSSTAAFLDTPERDFIAQFVIVIGLRVAACSRSKNIRIYKEI